MSITSPFLRMLGVLEVIEEGDYITVYNIRSDMFSKDLQKVWNTNRIFKHMFKSVSRNKMTFHKFFAIEFYFLMRSLSKSKDKRFIKSMVCNKVIDLMYEHTWLKNVKYVFGDIVDREINPDVRLPLNYKALDKFVFKPYPHQLDFFETYALHKKALELRGFYLTSPPGSGKTLMAMMLRELLGLDKLIVVCPKPAVHEVWTKDPIKHYKKKPKMWDSVSNSGPIDISAEIIVVHYQSLPRLLEAMPKLNKYKVMVNLDEGHNFNDIKSQQTQNFLKLSEGLTNCQDILWGSGTHIKSIGTEAIPFLATVTKGFNSHLIERFKKIYGSSSTTLSELLANRLGLKVYTVAKSEVVDGTPIEETIKVTMPNSDIYTLESIQEDMVSFIKDRVKYYEDEKQNLLMDYTYGIDKFISRGMNDTLAAEFKQYQSTIKTLRDSRSYMHLSDEMAYCNRFEKTHIEPLLSGEKLKAFRHAKSAVKYVMLKIRGEALGRILGKKRIECHVDMIKYANLPEIVKNSLSKTLIFTSYVEVVDETVEVMEKEGLKPLQVTGKNSSDLRNIVKQFETSEEKNPLVATLKTLSTAVPLTMANTVVFTNKPFRVHELEQAIARVWRIGQQHQVYVVHVELDTGEKANINTRSADIMAWSKEQVDILTGVTTTVSMEGELSTEIKIA